MKTGKLVVVLPNLNESHRQRIRDAAEGHGLEASFFDQVRDSIPALAEAEIVLGQSEHLAQHAPKLEWFCTPSAGVNHLLGSDTFASPDAVLTNSSGAYGVTIAEHTVMMLLSLFRRRLEYDSIVARREWKRDLPVKSIRDGRFVLAGTGDIGQEIAIRLRSFGPKSVIGINRSGRNPGGLFDQALPISA